MKMQPAAARNSLALAIQLALAVTALSIPTFSSAQSSGAEAGAMEEILVTAQRREERLQDVPIAISALGQEELSKRGVADLSELRGAVPGLAITHSAGVNASNLIAIRGVGGLPTAIGAGQATGVYLDGVYLPRIDAAFFSLDDVERIEVLRGPQGTLYGRNATAGAVNIITREPGEEFRGGFDASFGDHKAAKAKGSFSGPIGGNWYGGLSLSYEDRDGYFRNIQTGNILDTRTTYTARGKLRYAGDSTSVTLAADTSTIDAREALKNGYVGTTFVGLGNPNEVTVAPRNEQLTFLETGSDGVSLTINHSFSDQLDLTAITSYRTLDVTDSYNFPAIPALHSYVIGDNETFDQELRLLVTRERFRATVGANYYADKQNWALQVAPVPATGPLLSLTPNRAISDIKSSALFGQFEFDMSDRLTAVLGARYTNENRDWVLDTRGAAAPGPRVPGTIEDTAVTPALGLNFKLQPDVLLYVRASKGYQAPGFNAGADGATATRLLAQNSPLTFEAEDLTAYETGVKSQFMDRRITLNVSAFLYDYQNLQVRSNLGPTPGVPGPGSAIINNAADSTIEGVEAMLSAQLSDNWSIALQATSLNAAYDRYCQGTAGGAPAANDPLCQLPNLPNGQPDASAAANRAGNKLNQAPDFSGGFAISYAQPVGGGTISANAQYSWESNSYLSPPNESQISTGGWNRLDARVGFETEGGLEIYAMGKNLTDDRYMSFVQRVLPTATFFSINEPTTYALGVRKKF